MYYYYQKNVLTPDRHPYRITHADQKDDVFHLHVKLLFPNFTDSLPNWENIESLTKRT